MKRIIIIATALLLSLYVSAQEVHPVADSLRKDAINVFMDATNYIKERITFINYVRDRKVADLVIVSTSENTGSGGRIYTMFLEGQGKYEGMTDTLKYSTSPDETLEHRREKEVKTLKMGLMPYIIKTPLAKYIDIKFTEPISTEVSTDKWNSWVFNSNITAWSNGQTSSTTFDTYGTTSASKVTEDYKFNVNLNYSYGYERYDYIDEYTDTSYISRTNSKSANSLYVKSINDHWSLGGSAGIYSSSFANYRLKSYVAPGIEYNIFPYSESTSRQFRFLYSLGFTFNDYIDTTTYNKLKEGLMYHSLRGSYEVIQKWGSISISVAWSNHLQDFTQNELSIYNTIDWRIAKGLSVTAGAGFSFINNQINLRKGELTAEEILLETQELLTDYSYYMHFGFSYTFGSIYNNVVNPRFGNSGGGKTVIVY